MQPDSSAPVIVKASVDIETNPEHIWDIMSDFENWPRWNPEIQSVELLGPLVEGTGFKWKAGPGTINSKLTHVEKPIKLAWTGVTFGIKAIHVWDIRLIESVSRVTTEESWNGLHVRIFKKYFQKMLERSIHSGLKYLKVEAEKGHHS
jgi:uncharacterized membrane protein